MVSFQDLFMKVFAEKCTLVRIQSSAPYVPVAQMEEHVTFNHGVRGSIPRWITKSKHTQKSVFFFCFSFGKDEPKGSDRLAADGNPFVALRHFP